MHILYSSHVCVQLVSGIAFSAMVKRNELESWGVCFHKKNLNSTVFHSEKINAEVLASNVI